MSSLSVTSLHSSQVGISGSNLLGLVTTRDTIKATLANETPTTKAAGATETKISSSENSNTSSSSSSSQNNKTTVRELTPAEQRRVAELKQIDAEVHAHELAHLSAGQGVVTSGPNYSYTYGPDGKQYATAGEVGIDTSPEKKAEDNITKGQRIQSAALAPRDPSPQDYQVAATGSSLEAKGRSDLASERLEQQQEAQAKAEADRKAAADEVASSKTSSKTSSESNAPTNVEVSSTTTADVSAKDVPNKTESNAASASNASSIQAYLSSANTNTSSQEKRINVFA